MRNFLVLSYVFIQFFSFGQIEEVKRWTQTLCSPEFHGRGYVNRGDSIASEFLAAEFKKLGVKPIKKSYFQGFNHTVNTFPGAMLVRIDENVLVPGTDFIVDPSSCGDKRVLNPKRISIETALDNEKLIAEIKSVINSSLYNCVAFDFSGASADTLKKLRNLPTEVAGLLPVIQVTSEKFTWSVGHEQTKFPLILIRDTAMKFDTGIHIAIEAKLIEDYTSRNVIAYLPAKKKSKKTIVYTAHYDHLGRMGTDTYFPGANDNASGTAMLLSMAAYFKKNPVDYNVLFIAFAGEEAGLVGSKHFVENPTFKLKKMSFLLNLDIMGSGEEGVTVVNATLFEKQFALLQEINKEKQLLAQVKSRGPAANSDHYWFTQFNVPAFFIYTMGPNKHYHDIFDTYEELSFVEYQDITTMLVEFGKLYTK